MLIVSRHGEFICLVSFLVSCSHQRFDELVSYSSLFSSLMKFLDKMVVFFWWFLVHPGTSRPFKKLHNRCMAKCQMSRSGKGEKSLNFCILYFSPMSHVLFPGDKCTKLGNESSLPMPFSSSDGDCILFPSGGHSGGLWAMPPSFI